MPRVKKAGTAKVVGVTNGSHLKVTHYDDGSTDLEWDWKALQRDVAEAIASVAKKDIVAVTEEKVKRTRTKKSA